MVLTIVYDPSDGTGVVPDDGLPPWPDGPGLDGALDAALVEVGQGHGALVADVHRRLWDYGVIEPNAWGAHEIRCARWSALESAGFAR